MNISAKTFHLLSLTIIIVSLCGFWTPGTYAYIGEAVGSDMYRDLDSRYNTLYTNLLKKGLTGFTNRVDTELSGTVPFCKNVGGCIDTWKKFSLAELENIAAGNADISIVKSHLREKLSPSTDDIDLILKKIKQLYADTRGQMQDTQKNLGEISLIGLYTDGSLDNSSFDLAYDLEQIHKVIFSESVPYDGYENEASRGMVDFFGWLFWNASDTTNGSSSGPNTTPTSSGNSNTGTTSGWTNASDASSASWVLSGCNPTELTNLDNGLFTDIRDLTSSTQDSTINTGTANPSGAQGSGPGNSGPSGQSTPSRSKPRNNKLTDSFPCSTFFCIRVNMIIYEQKLLWGGRTYSLESIIDENIKISNKFAASSMAQTKMTKNFFELSFKNLNLASRLHLGVMVTSMPVPLLNVEKSATDPLNKKPEETPGEILKKTFEDQCINWKQPNKLDISGTKNKLAIEQSAELSTTDFSDKQDSVVTCNQWPVSYNELMNSRLRNDYYVSFNNDLLELRTFTSAIQQNLDNIIGVIKLLHEKH